MQNLFKLLAVALALGAIITSSTRLLAQPDQPTAAALRAKISHDLPGWLKQYNVPGASVTYVATGRLAWTVVAGEQSPGVPATEKTLYNIASLTKPIVAETILRLASQNKLQLDEPIYPYWVDPDIKNNPWNKLPTPRLCLSHQTGFANWRRMTGGTLTFRFQPGTQSSYSGEGYFYVARFAQNKTGVPFDRPAENYVLSPLRMKDTSFTAKEWFNGRLAQPYADGAFAPPTLTSTWNAADLVETTITDYAHFVAGVMRNEGLRSTIAAECLVMTRDWTSEDAREQVCTHETPRTACHVSAGMGLG
jgi:CubicO group peptidase (beta-lactamase class C family)